MSTNRFAVEGPMDEMELKYFAREEDNGSSWILMFQDGGVLVRPIEQGEFLMVRSLPLAKLSLLDDKQLPIENGGLTSNQLKRCLGAVSSELVHFEVALESLC